MTILRHDMVGDVMKCSEFVSVGSTSLKEINSKGLPKPLSYFSRCPPFSAKMSSDNRGLIEGGEYEFTKIPLHSIILTSDLVMSL